MVQHYLDHKLHTVVKVKFCIGERRLPMRLRQCPNMMRSPFELNYANLPVAQVLNLFSLWKIQKLWSGMSHRNVTGSLCTAATSQGKMSRLSTPGGARQAGGGSLLLHKGKNVSSFAPPLSQGGQRSGVWSWWGFTVCVLVSMTKTKQRRHWRMERHFEEEVDNDLAKNVQKSLKSLIMCKGHIYSTLLTFLVFISNIFV